jgi:hypothetical protein
LRKRGSIEASLGTGQIPLFNGNDRFSVECQMPPAKVQMRIPTDFLLAPERIGISFLFIAGKTCFD